MILTLLHSSLLPVSLQLSSLLRDQFFFSPRHHVRVTVQTENNEVKQSARSSKILFSVKGRHKTTSETDTGSHEVQWFGGDHFCPRQTSAAADEKARKQAGEKGSEVARLMWPLSASVLLLRGLRSRENYKGPWGLVVAVSVLLWRSLVR